MKSIKYAIGFLGIVSFLMAAPLAANAESCVAACLGKGAECLQTCLMPKAALHSTPLKQTQPGKTNEPIMLACTQLPIRCSSNSDCTCSSCCGSMGGVNVCQPSC